MIDKDQEVGGSAPPKQWKSLSGSKSKKNDSVPDSDSDPEGGCRDNP